MKKWFALLFMVCMMASVALAEEGGTVVYTEDFEGEECSVVLWDETTGTIEVVEDEDGNHVLMCVTNTGDDVNGYFHAIFGPQVGDFDLTMRVRPDNIKNPDYNWMKICSRAYVAEGEDGGENESYIFEIWDWRGAFSIKSTVNRRSETKKLDENQDFWFINGEWYDVRIEARGSTLTVYVDDKECVSLTDPDDLFMEGAFALCSWGVNFSVDDIVVTAY